MIGLTTLVTDIKRNSLDDGPGIRTTVFFKGCPLSCTWCQNPETKSGAQQIVYEAAYCFGCESCTRACVTGAISITRQGGYPVDKNKCGLNAGCRGACMDACPRNALRPAGVAYSPQELYNKLIKDAVFYKHSNGGVTFSGGEPTLHMPYLSQLAVMLKEKSVHLCLETCGHYEHDRFERLLLPYLDLIYFDIKFISNQKHKEYCGMPNDIILDNFRELLSLKDVALLPRVPLVPGVTAQRDNLLEIRDFFTKCGIREISLLPYNPLWLSKLPGMGIDSAYSHDSWMSKAEKDEVKEIFAGFSYRDF